jgi:hypothetical protein
LVFFVASLVAVRSPKVGTSGGHSACLSSHRFQPLEDVGRAGLSEAAASAPFSNVREIRVRNGFARERRESACGVREEGEHRIGFACLAGKIPGTIAGRSDRSMGVRQDYYMAE